MKTVSTAVEGVVQIWAEPKSQYRMEREATETPGVSIFPFSYELRTSSPYGSDNVMVAEVPMTLHVPAGINLLAKAIETLDKAMQEERTQSALRIADLQAKANRLLMIEFKPDSSSQSDGEEEGPPVDHPSMQSVVGMDPDLDNPNGSTIEGEATRTIGEESDDEFGVEQVSGMSTIYDPTDAEIDEMDQAEQDYQDANPEDDAPRETLHPGQD